MARADIAVRASVSREPVRAATDHAERDSVAGFTPQAVITTAKGTGCLAFTVMD
ncbi:hypothetical protein SAMN05421630_11067 [Prauserella marina]|uniref:Uncharacterized protein n=1 Tax=Prauserella marina TaxID=530584 RepID=A0A1G6VXU5_9PSEU|nr:hypothetical protein DES30_10867 [Prauserella marina]SDD58391.1 hypothetical protein SAMN05421630_11067 [Prauserella marina]